MFTILTWNVENLFRPTQVATADVRQAYEDKLEFLAQVIAQHDPDMIALQEVGGLEPLADLQDANLLSVLRIAGSTLTHSDSEVLEHWKGKEIEVRFKSMQTYLLDDSERTANAVKIRVLPGALTVIVPAS